MNAPGAPATGKKNRQPYTAQDADKECAILANRPALVQAIAAGDWVTVQHLQAVNRAICGVP